MEAFIDNLLSPAAKKILILASKGDYSSFKLTVVKMRNDGEMNAFATNRPPLRLDEPDCLSHITSALYKYMRTSTISTAAPASVEAGKKKPKISTNS